jgi:hypothetical protein
LTLQNNTTGSYNVGLGSENYVYNTSGYNTAVGSMALRSNIMETITRLGYSLGSNTSGGGNTASGYNSLL